MEPLLIMAIIITLAQILEATQFTAVNMQLTWDQAQFERFSYILSNGYRWNWFRLARRNVIFKAIRK